MSKVRIEDRSRKLLEFSIEGEPGFWESLGNSRSLVFPYLEESSKGSGTEFNFTDHMDTFSMDAAVWRLISEGCKTFEAPWSLNFSTPSANEPMRSEASAYVDPRIAFAIGFEGKSTNFVCFSFLIR